MPTTIKLKQSIVSTGKRRNQAEATGKEKESGTKENKILLRKARIAIRGNRQMGKGNTGASKTKKGKQELTDLKVQMKSDTQAG